MTSLFDILLLSVVVATAYMGPMLLRRLPPGRKTFGWMVVGDLVLALLAFASQGEDEGRLSQLLGAVAIGGAVCLLVVPPIVRDLVRRALAAERFRLAKALVDLRELLQPGMGGKQESELIGTILAVRRGHVDEAVAGLRAQRKKAEHPLVRREFDERIVMTLLYARRWQDAIDSYESSFATDFSRPSPQLIVETIRAYCEVHDLESAAGLMDRLESSPLVTEPLLAALLFRARLVFLAFVGRTGAVEAIANGPLAEMPEPARHYWAGIARLNAGDKNGARTSLSQAAGLLPRDSRTRELAESVLSTVDEPGVAGPHNFSPQVAHLADRLTTVAADAGRQPRSARKKAVQRRPVVTLSLIALNLAAALAMTLTFNSSSDIGGLVRAGANVKSAVAAGEWWRLGSSMFLHVGALHLLLNMYGLWILGGLVEPLYGRVRFFGIYMAAGLAGAAASMLFGGAATSVGASGAVFGLLGAAIAELGLHRDAYPSAWRKRLLGNLLFLTAANIGIGFAIAMIDQAAHLGGLVAGALLAAALSPKGRFGGHLASRLATIAVAAVGALAIAYGAVGVATTSFAETLRAYPRTERIVGGLQVTVPEPWVVNEANGLQDQSLPLLLYLTRLPREATAAQVVEARIEAELQGGAKALGFDRVAVANERALSLPGGWSSGELIATVEAEGLGGGQRYRAVVFAREVDDELWFGVTYIPATLVAELGELLADVLGSAKPVGPLPELPLDEASP